MCIIFGLYLAAEQKDRVHMETAYEKDLCNERLRTLVVKHDNLIAEKEEPEIPPTSQERNEIERMRLRMIIMQNKIDTYHKLHDAIMSENNDEKENMMDMNDKLSQI